MFRHAYRMHIETFYALYKCIKEELIICCKYDGERSFAPNGRIHLTVRLDVALRLFSGGDPLDIACLYGISKTEVHNSLEHVCDAVNKTDSLKIVFPSSHLAQQEIAQGFKTLSKADFDTCCGAIDGMLIWLSKPIEEECIKVGVGSKKFFCGRKKSLV